MRFEASSYTKVPFSLVNRCKYIERHWERRKHIRCTNLARLPSCVFLRCEVNGPQEGNGCGSIFSLNPAWPNDLSAKLTLTQPVGAGRCTVRESGVGVVKSVTSGRPRLPTNQNAGNLVNLAADIRSRRHEFAYLCSNCWRGSAAWIGQTNI